MTGPRTSKGFSLLELIIAIGIMGVVTTVGMAMFFRLFDGWQANAAEVELDQAAIQVFAALRRDFLQVAGTDWQDAPIKVQHRHIQNNTIDYVGLLANDRLELRVLAGSPPVLQTIVYEVARTQNTLTRTVANSAREGGERSVLAEGIIHFRVECAGPDGAWRNGWMDPEPPALIRASLVVRHPEHPSEELGRTTLFAIPTSPKGAR